MKIRQVRKRTQKKYIFFSGLLHLYIVKIQNGIRNQLTYELWNIVRSDADIQSQ